GLDIHVDVAVEVGDVEQALQVVRSDFTLLLQAGQGVSALGTGGDGAFRHGMDSFLLLGRGLGPLRALALSGLGLAAGGAAGLLARALLGTGRRLGLALRFVGLGQRGGFVGGLGHAGLPLRLALALGLLPLGRPGLGAVLVVDRGLTLDHGAVGLGDETVLAQTVDELALVLVAVPALGDDGLDDGALTTVARPAVLPDVPGAALQVGGLGLGARGRVVVDDVHLLAHGPHVGGQPVDEDTDREVDAEDGEDDGEDVH